MKNIPTNIVTVKPVIEPVTVSEVKSQAMIASSVSHHDSLILQLITEARQTVEMLANRSLITQTRRQFYDTLPHEMYLRYGPAVSVSSITYADSQGTSQTLSSSLYTLDAQSIPARICEAFNQTFPSAAIALNSCYVTYVAGYGSETNLVPMIYRRSIQMLAAYRFTHRELGEDDSKAMEALSSMLSLAGSTPEYA